MKLTGSDLLQKLDQLKSEGITGRDAQKLCGYDDASSFWLVWNNANEEINGKELDINLDSFTYTDTPNSMVNEYGLVST